MRIKIGNLEILAERKPKAPDVDERGATGTQIFSGFVHEEYNTELVGQKAVTVYDKMRKSDARVKSVILVCELPLRAATWAIEPAGDNDQDKEVADFVSSNLFDGMSITWDSFLHHTLLMLPYGFSIFEKVWKIENGQIMYQKLAPRLAKTLYRWQINDNGGLIGIEQHVYKNNTFQFIPIPAEKLLIFTNEKEGSNFEGVSILRTAYKHWYYKDNFYRIDGIAAENNAIGIPTFKHPANAPADQKKLLDDMGSHLYAHEQNYVRLPVDYEFDIKGVSGAVRDIMPSIMHHDKKISESVLADFLDLGSGNSKGSWALSKDKSSFFLMSLGAVGRNITDTFNEYVIKPLVDYNFQVSAYPKLQVSGLETRDMEVYAKTVTELLTSGGLTPDLPTENKLRSMLEFPAKDEADYQKPNPVNGIPPLSPPNENAEVDVKKKRDLTPAEKFVSFGEIEKKLDDTEALFVQATKDVMAQQISNLVDVAAKIIEKRQLDKVGDIQVRYTSQMSDKMYAILKDLMQYGQAQVKEEIQKQAETKLIEPPPIRPDDPAIIEEFLRARAKASAASVANKIKQFTTFEVLRQIKSAVLEPETLKKGLLDLSDKELLATAKLSTSEAFNFGRGVAAATLSDEIDRVQYSALLDGNQCHTCEKMDGQEWDFEDEKTDYYASGNPQCEGGGKCRCMLIYIFSSEARAVV